LENVLANAENIKGKLGEKIRDNAELGLLSKKLATIILDVPVELDEENLILSPIDEKAIEEIFQELEFRTLLRKVLQKPEDMPIAKAASATAASNVSIEIRRSGNSRLSGCRAASAGSSRLRSSSGPTMVAPGRVLWAPRSSS